MIDRDVQLYIVDREEEIDFFAWDEDTEPVVCVNDDWAEFENWRELV